MTAVASGRISAAKTGWIIVLLMVGWALFLILPFGREEKIELPKTPATHPGEEELVAVGLRYNVDWIGLPEYFNVWAGGLSWDDNKVFFAYWNPGSESYSYFFEATVNAGKYRFRQVVRQDISDKGLYYYKDDGGEGIITIEAAELRTKSDTHPFVFWTVLKLPTNFEHGGRLGVLLKRSEPSKLNIDIPKVPLAVPKSLDHKPTLDESRK